MLLTHQDEAFFSFKKLCRHLQKDKGFAISNIKTNHGRDLENGSFAKFCDEHNIGHTSRLL